MVRTIVCEKDGCSGNEFYINSKDNKIKLVCSECKKEYYYDNNSYDFKILSSCSSCNNSKFKVFKDLDSDAIYAKCTKCGAPPEKVFIDSDGVQVTYEAKLLHDIKDLMHQVDQRVCNLELKVEGLEKGHELLEESLAYINKYMCK
ncbi:hypothetical protein [Clostridium taeniosporum]|uniref:Uncharacterized protein n=1 Tax=Clostridium taeniosporum TaxID=394958 RepID=A0A1D7XNK3_9CLOT|nr:hypothetical protein [Clostridium taeniosporum]AOR24709.1 hypothetical protein BGI42_13585 [Clostridium taeniosporum]